MSKPDSDQLEGRDNAAPITVGLADDQTLVRAGFAMVLNSQPDIEVIWEASDGEEALTQAAHKAPDIVLMDVQMPVLDGISATRELLGDAPMAASGRPTRVVVLTTFDSQNYILGAIDAGASGFLLKDTAPEALIQDIRTVAHSDALISRKAMAALIPSSEEKRNAEFVNDGLVDPLTPREMEILELIARGKSNQEIASELFISLPTVKTHVGKVLAKTQSRDRVQAVLFAFRRGLVTQQQLLAE